MELTLRFSAQFIHRHRPSRSEIFGIAFIQHHLIQSVHNHAQFTLFMGEVGTLST